MQLSSTLHNNCTQINSDDELITTKIKMKSIVAEVSHFRIAKTNVRYIGTLLPVSVSP